MCCCSNEALHIYNPSSKFLDTSFFFSLSGNANEIYCDRYHTVQFPGSGHIAHMNYPFNYTEKLTCKHSIYIPPTLTIDWQICFTFRRFHLENLSENGFGDYLEFPGQLRFSGNGFSAMDFSKAPPSPLLKSDPRSNVFYENLCCALFICLSVPLLSLR